MAKTKSQSVRDVMTNSPVILAADSPLAEAARAMADSNIGDVIVRKNGEICGILTDRDIVVRGIARGKDPSTTPLNEICSQDLTTVTADAPVDEAVQLMRDKAIRRLPVVDGGEPVGILSLGDLAIQRDPKSALADISEASPNQ